MRWIPVVLILSLALIACEPEYLSPDAIEPVEGANAIGAAADEIDLILVEHSVRIADMNARIASSEEQLSFDVTRAKRQLVGKTDSIRRDVDSMIDVHEQNARTELSRARSRVIEYDAEVRSIGVEQLTLLSQIDPLDYDEARLTSIVDAMRDTNGTETVESIVTDAQETTVRAADAIENELNKIRDTRI